MRGNEANRVISVSQGGLYHCRGGRGDPVYYTEDSSDVTVTDTHKPKAKLRADNTTVPVGGSVTLTCSVNPSSPSGWKYYWYRDDTTVDVISPSNGQISVSQEGLYRCRGGRGNPVYYTEDSQEVHINKTLTVSGADSSSSPVWLIVGLVCGVSLIIILLLLLYHCRRTNTSKPRATLTAQSSIIPAGGSVTLSCSVEGSAGWKFDWFRRDSQFSGAQKIGAGTSEHTISISEGGNYYCRGGRGDPVFSTEDSAPVTIQKQVLAAVKLQHSWSQIFTGETITLRCEIQGGEGKVWKYEWTAPNTNSPPTSSEYRISRVSVSHSGDYRCRGSSDYLLTGWSDAFTLTVSSSKPRATLTAQSSVIPAGGSVTLSCSVEGSAGWKFDWFRRDSVSSKAQLMRGNEANRVISVSQGGLYHCRGGRGDPVYYTEDSSDVTVKETLPSKPTVTLQPSWTQIYSGETVTVRCEIQGGEGAQWTYEWRATKLNTPPTSNEHRIIRATESDSGGYSCRGRRDYFFSEWSDIITLTVSYKPKAKLRADNTAVPVGGSVTLTCSVNPSSSSGWKYYWYRDEKSSEALTTQDAVFHSNGQISVSQEGLYRCRGGRGNPVYYTEDSQSVRIGKTDVHSAASLTVSPDRVQHFPSDSVSLTCEGNFTEWRVSKFSEKGFFSHCCDCQKLSGSSYKIHSLQEGVTVYWCESGSGELSNAVNITVQGFGSKISSFIVPFIIGLVSGIILVLLLLCCCRKIKVFIACFSLTQSQSTNQSSAAQQKANKNEDNVYSSLLPGDFPVYEIIRSSGNTGSGGPADEHRNITSTLELKVIDEKTDFRKWRNDDPDGSSDYEDDDHETGSVSGSGRGRGH
ncbi:unnamed protein product [Oreochromis niloticus]|nr:unnamed protein product [Mustela putorius furo]